MQRKHNFELTIRTADGHILTIATAKFETILNKVLKLREEGLLFHSDENTNAECIDTPMVSEYKIQ